MPPAKSKPKQEDGQDQHDYQAFIGGKQKAGFDAGENFFKARHKIFVADLFTAETPAVAKVAMAGRRRSQRQN